MTLFEQLEKTDLILGSQSPRRRDLLEKAGFKFRIQVIPTEEFFPGDMHTAHIPLYLCKQKAKPFLNQLTENSVLITADTIVVKDDHVLNKASDSDDAYRMLSMLSGTSHEVITGVCIAGATRKTIFSETTKVFFRSLTDREINYYITNYRPMDKAGAYGIQEWIGLAAVSRIEGCYYNVVGLPVPALFRHLKAFMDYL